MNICTAFFSLYLHFFFSLTISHQLIYFQLVFACIRNFCAHRMVRATNSKEFRSLQWRKLGKVSAHRQKKMCARAKEQQRWNENCAQLRVLFVNNIREFIFLSDSLELFNWILLKLFWIDRKSERHNSLNTLTFTKGRRRRRRRKKLMSIFEKEKKNPSHSLWNITTLLRWELVVANKNTFKLKCIRSFNGKSFVFVILVPCSAMEFPLLVSFTFVVNNITFSTHRTKSIGMLITLMFGHNTKILTEFKFGFGFSMFVSRGGLSVLVYQKLLGKNSSQRTKLWRNDSFHTYTELLIDSLGKKPITNSLKLHFHLHTFVSHLKYMYSNAFIYDLIYGNVKMLLNSLELVIMLAISHFVC